MTSQKRHLSLSEGEFVKALTNTNHSIKINGNVYNYRNETERVSSNKAFKEKLVEQNIIEFANCMETIKSQDKYMVSKLHQDKTISEWMCTVKESYPDEIKLMESAIAIQLKAVQDAKFKNHTIRKIKEMTAAMKSAVAIFSAFLIKLGNVTAENYHTVMLLVTEFFEKVQVDIQSKVINQISNQLEQYISSREIEKFLPDEVLRWVNSDLQKLILKLFQTFFTQI